MKPFIVAEMSANHLGSLKRALDIVDAAYNAGANAVKVQTWTAGRMCIDPDYHLPRGPWAGMRLKDLYEQAYLPWEWHRTIFQKVRDAGMVPFSAAFDWEAVDFLETLGVDRHKCASFELTDLPLIRYMAGKGKPMILSTGMATAQEIGDAYGCIPPGRQTTTLQCTSAYPASPASANLLAGARWPRWGVSDHTLSNVVPIAATLMGTTYIEKHLTISRADGGPDAGFSLEPGEFEEMVQAVSDAALVLGEERYGPKPGEDTSLRRSLWVLRDIHAGEPLRFGDNVVTARPALGLPCDTQLAGRRAAVALKAGTALLQEHLA